MEPSSSIDRPNLQKTRTNSSSFRARRPSRTTSKYGSIVEERSYPNANRDQDDDADNDSEQEENPNHDTRQDSIHHASDRISFSSLDHEITLKDKQDVKLRLSTKANS